VDADADAVDADDTSGGASRIGGIRVKGVGPLATGTGAGTGAPTVPFRFACSLLKNAFLFQFSASPPSSSSFSAFDNPMACKS
jgi:hypothetical protein